MIQKFRLLVVVCMILMIFTACGEDKKVVKTEKLSEGLKIEELEGCTLDGSLPYKLNFYDTKEEAKEKAIPIYMDETVEKNTISFSLVSNGKQIKQLEAVIDDSVSKEDNLKYGGAFLISKENDDITSKFSLILPKWNELDDSIIMYRMVYYFDKPNDYLAFKTILQ